MAKSRAQRKAEQRKRREGEAQRNPNAGAAKPDSDQESEQQAQHDTQNPVSGDVAEAEAVIRTGADPSQYGEHVAEPRDPAAETEAKAEAAEARTPEAPAPSRADVGRPEPGAPGQEQPSKPSREERRAEKKREKERARKERERALARTQAEKAEKKRNPVIAFFISCWAELKKVQWPDRDTLVQASAVTLIFVVVAAAYLGVLDFIFNELIKLIL